jgi:hypothetical protein
MKDMFLRTLLLVIAVGYFSFSYGEKYGRQEEIKDMAPLIDECHECVEALGKCYVRESLHKI